MLPAGMLEDGVRFFFFEGRASWEGTDSDRETNTRTEEYHVPDVAKIKTKQKL
jgi:hypothetical protein